MHDLEPFHALGGRLPRHADIGTVTLCEMPNVALASVAARMGHEADCEAKLTELLGTNPPGPGKASLGTPFDTLWTGPDQWMISAPYDSHEDIADQVKSALGTSASVTEQSDAWVCLDLIGPGADAVMERLCNLDIRQIKEGDGTRTTIDHLGCLVMRRATISGLRIMGPRSSADSLFDAIKTAMHSAR